MSSEVSFQGGRQVPALSLVTPDNDTIIGDGTAADPLRVNSSGPGGTLTTYTIAATALANRPGQALAQSTLAPKTPIVAIASDAAKCVVLGLMTEIVSNPDNTVSITFQSSGDLELTTDHWDTVTGGSGGLTEGAVYYLSKDTGGLMVTARPVAAGSFVTQIGIAVNATTMRLQLSGAIGPHA